jgi:putative copper export protein
MTTGYLILARAVHFGTCLLFFGFFAFDRFVAASIFNTHKIEAADYWKSRLRLFSIVLLPLILLSGLAWFVLVAMVMSGQPPQLDIFKIVWFQTQFGTVWKIRLVIWISAMVAAIIFLFLRPGNQLQKNLNWFQVFSGGLLLGSLTWAGHGQENSRGHLIADVLHLLGAGVWPAGLLPFAILLRRLRADSEPRLGALIQRFSNVSLGAVLLMAATGVVNACSLVGSFSDLVSQPYGRWLLVKIGLFGVATAIGALNLLRLKPRLSFADPRSAAAQIAGARLQANVQVELMLAAAVVIVVAVLGILPP